LGFAFAIASHLVAGLAVGAGIGYLLDRWLGTLPAFLLTFFVLGAGAGGMSIFRMVKGYGMALGFRRAEENRDSAHSERSETGGGNKE
jgi:ATP synthase protein I